MLQEFKLPALGENIAAGQVVKVLVKAGDAVKKDQSVLELETDKAVIEIPSPYEGTVKEILVKPGDKAKVDQPVMKIETGAGGEKKAAPKVAEEVPAPQPVPQEPKKAAPQAPAKSVVTEAAPKKQAPPVSQPQPRQEQRVPEIVPKTESTSRVVPFASPSVRRFAREMGVDLAEVTASSPDGRLTEDDIKDHVRRKNAQGAEPNASALSVSSELPDFSRWGAVEEKPMSQIRLATARHMHQSWSTIPHVTQFDSADITDVLELRKRFAKRVEAAGGNLTITAILLKVIASALKVFPQFNASIDVPNERIIYKKYFHVGVAVDTERGLVVPIIRDVDKKNILELSVELNQMAQKARDRKTTLEEMQGGSFTITNLGSIGGTHFTPIIRAPEVAILGVGRSSQQPVWQENQWVPRMILPLALSYDHRLIDGADAARFLRWLADAVQEPFLMDLEG